MDLRKNSKLNTIDSKFLDDNMDSLIKSYNEFIGKFIEVNNLKNLSLLIPSTCRNPFDSYLFDYFSKLFLLENAIRFQEIPDLLIIDDIQLEAINSILIKYSLQHKIKIQIKKTDFLIQRIFLNILKSFYYVFNDWFWTRVINTKKIPKDEIIYLDSFLQLNTIDPEGFATDRHYPDHQNFLPPEFMNKVWVAPTLIAIRSQSDYIKILTRINKSKTKFLIQESWLTTLDYFYSFIMAILIPLRKLEFNSINKIPSKCLMRSLFYRDIGSPVLMKAIYRYRFIKRLASKNIKIRTAINWHENQIIDRSLNLSFRKFYPKVTVKGYQGFPSMESYVSIQPTCYENDLGTLPHQICVISDTYKQSKLEVCNSLDVTTSPAFRYSYLFKFVRKKNARNKQLILVLLPGIITEINETLNVANYLRSVLPDKVEVVIKLHPRYSVKDIGKFIPEFSNNQLPVTGEILENLLPYTDILVTSGSSSAVEAVAVGIPTVICANHYGLTNNFIPKSVSEDLSAVCYNHNQIKNFVELSLSRGVYNNSVDEFFCKPSEKLTYMLFSS